VRQQRITLWIIVAVVACAALGGWAGSHLGDGQGGMVILIGATCGVLGSFLPGSVRWVRARLDKSGTRRLNV
jgi:outer membrane lipoprotein SlyB